MNRAVGDASAQKSTGQALLAELQVAHSDLLMAIQAMQQLTSEALFDVKRYADARWRLGRASRTRRKVIEQACQALITRASEADIALLKSLRADDVSAIRQSSAHIHQWPLEAVRADWLGYCSASFPIQARMRQRIQDEQKRLTPLLAKY